MDFSVAKYINDRDDGIKDCNDDDEILTAIIMQWWRQRR